MAKWWKNVTKVKYSKWNPVTGKGDKRMLTLFDMAEAKREEARVNSQIKRGEIKKGNFRNMYNCTCGFSGCIGVTEHQIAKEDWDRFNKDK